MRKRTLFLGTFALLLACAGPLLFLYGQRGNDPISREVRKIDDQIRQVEIQRSKLELEVKELQIRRAETLQQARQKARGAAEDRGRPAGEAGAGDRPAAEQDARRR